MWFDELPVKILSVSLKHQYLQHMYWLGILFTLLNRLTFEQIPSMPLKIISLSSLPLIFLFPSVPHCHYNFHCHYRSPAVKLLLSSVEKMIMPLPPCSLYCPSAAGVVAQATRPHEHHVRPIVTDQRCATRELLPFHCCPQPSSSAIIPFAFPDRPSSAAYSTSSRRWPGWRCDCDCAQQAPEGGFGCHQIIQKLLAYEYEAPLTLL